MHIGINPKEPPAPRSNTSMPLSPRAPPGGSPTPPSPIMPSKNAPRPEITAADPGSVEKMATSSKQFGHVGCSDTGGAETTDVPTKARNEGGVGGGRARITCDSAGERDAQSAGAERRAVQIRNAGQDSNGSKTKMNGIVRRDQGTSHGGEMAQEDHQNALLLLLASVPLSASPKPRAATPPSSLQSPRYGGNVELIGHEASGTVTLRKKVPSPRTPREDARQVNLPLRDASTREGYVARIHLHVCASSQMQLLSSPGCQALRRLGCGMVAL
jgi:hypothetical protein